MGFRRMFDQFEGVAELGVQRIGRIPHHWEPAALYRPVRPEHRDLLARYHVVIERRDSAVPSK